MRSLRVVPPSELNVAEDGSYDIPDPSSSTGRASTGRASSDTDPSRGGIVVQAEDGERFQLTVDDALRSAVGPIAPAAVAEPEPAPAPRPRPVSSHPLSPREIQTRVRAGESAQDLADDSATPMDKIMRFAYAVLEERSRVADEARRARARRDGDGNLVPFGETVDGRFAAHAIEPQSVEWDSFRRPDGSWVVSAAWTADGTERHAHWAFSLTARTVLPLDQVSSDLLSDRPLSPVVQVVPDRGTTPLVELYDQEAPDAAGYTAPSPPAGWLRPGSSGAAPRVPADTDDHPRLPLRLAEPWSYGGRSETAQDARATSSDEDPSDASDTEDVAPGANTKLDDLFGGAVGDDSVPPTTPSNNGRSGHAQPEQGAALGRHPAQHAPQERLTPLCNRLADSSGRAGSGVL